MADIMEILGPELPLRDFGSPLDVDGAALAIPGTECMEGSGHCSKPAAGRCSPLLVSLPLHNTAGANHYLGGRLIAQDDTYALPYYGPVPGDSSLRALKARAQAAYGAAPLDFALGGTSTSSYNSNSTPMHCQGTEQLGMPLSSPILSLNPSETSALRDSIFDGALVREDAGIHSLAHAPVGAEGSSVSTDKDSEIDIEGALFVDEEEDGSSLDGAPEQGRHAAKRGVRATIAAAAAGALDNSDSDYHPPGKLGDDCSPRRSLRSGRGRPAQAFSGPTKSRGGKKVGRPIAFKGDPDDEGLCDDEKRRIKRRIANRESARRVRQKRQDLMEEQQAKIQTMQAQNQRLLSHCNTLERQKSMLLSQLSEFHDKYCSAASEASRLRGEIATLRRTLEVNMQYLERAGLAPEHPQQPPPHYTPLHQTASEGSPREASEMPSPYHTTFSPHDNMWVASMWS